MQHRQSHNGHMSHTHQCSDVAQEDWLETRHADELACCSKSSLHELLPKHKATAAAAACGSTAAAAAAAATTNAAVTPSRRGTISLQQPSQPRCSKHRHNRRQQRLLYRHVLYVEQHGAESSAQLAGLQPAAGEEEGGGEGRDGGP